MAALTATACGSDERTASTSARKPPRPPACAVVTTRTVAQALHVPQREVRAGPAQASEVSRCRFRAGAAIVEVIVDTAASASTRYRYSVEEQQQFYADEPKLRPRPVKGVGTDHPYVPGANWTPARQQLVALRGERIVKVSVEKVPEAKARRSAAEIGRAAFSR